MKKILFILLVFCFHFSNGQSRESEIDAYMLNHLKNSDFSGTILIALKDSLVFQKAYGYSDTARTVLNDIHTLYRISSLTKTFTASLIIKLKEEGELNFEDAVSKYLPTYPNGDKITIDHLLRHRSGIPDFTDFPDYKSRMENTMTTEDLVNWFKDKPLKFTPGTASSYSNSGYCLLALIVEKIKGKNYGSVLEREVLSPLGLSSTAIDSIGKYYNKGHATGFKIKDNLGLSSVPPYRIENFIGCGFLSSSVNDLHKWVRSIFTSRLYNAQKNPTYGWGVRKYFNRDLLEQSGRTDGFVSYVAYYFKDGLSIVFLGNIESYLMGQLGRDLAAIYYGEPYLTPLFRTQVKLGKNEMRS